jgi:hypothetical protein
MPQHQRFAFALCLSLLSICVHAQDPFESSEDAQASAPQWSWFGDALLRGEYTKRIPARADDIDRIRARVRTGAIYLGETGWEYGAAIEFAAGNDRSADNRRNKDNERSNDINLDQLYARYSLSEAAQLSFGKTELPLMLSPLVWDHDLRPIGISAIWQADSASGGLAQISGGYFAPDFIFDNEKPRLAALQGSYTWFAGQATRLQAALSYLHFDKLDGLAANGIARTNLRAGANFLSDYELINLQLGAQASIFENPVRVQLDGVRNLGAEGAGESADEGGRISLVFGDRTMAPVEFGVAQQRAQRDAVLAIAADDDWWFQSFANGTMAWVDYQIDPIFAVRFAALRERRDLFPSHTSRLLLDFSANW